MANYRATLCYSFAMHQIQVTTVIDADRERTFEALSDHERFLSGQGLSCQLVRAGASEPNGLGARRRVDAGNLVFNEDIVAFERPISYQYLITELGGSLGRWLPLEHQLGLLEFTDTDSGTRVDWKSRFLVRIPILGWLIERMFGVGLKGSFNKLLAKANRELTSKP
jgi:hypothetical protein